MWAQIYTSHIASTMTLATTGFTPIAATTAFKACSNSFRYVKPEPKDTTSVRFVIGKDGKGIWQTSFLTSMKSDQGNKDYHLAIHKNGTLVECLSIDREIGTTAAAIQISLNGVLPTLYTNDYIDMRISPESTGMELTITHFNFSMVRITSSTHRGFIG